MEVMDFVKIPWSIFIIFSKSSATSLAIDNVTDKKVNMKIVHQDNIIVFLLCLLSWPLIW